MQLILGALRTALLDDAAVQAIVVGRVYWQRLPSEVAARAVRGDRPPSIVLRQTGGQVGEPRDPLQGQDIDVISWGDTIGGLAKLDAAVVGALSTVQRRVVDGTLVHTVSHGGATYGSEPETGWDYLVRPYEVVFDERSAADG